MSGAPANQIRTIVSSRSGTNIILRWALNQANGKQTKLYFKRADNGTTYLLTPQALNSALTSFTLDSQALASPCGNFWGTQFSIGVETGAGPSTDLGSSRPGEQGTQDGCGGPPPTSPSPAMKFVNSYRHLDHLGSLRIARADSGAPEGGVSSVLDLYPFGSPFASAVANSRRQFTGHERDRGVGADYMLARFNNPAMGRFLSAHPVTGKPQDVNSWNMFSYVQSRPINTTDPDGRRIVYMGTTQEQKKSLASSLRGLPKADRGAVTVTKDKNGNTVVSVNGAHKSTSQEFQAFKQLANSPGVVQVFQASASTPVPAVPNVPAVTSTPSTFGGYMALGFQGLTVPSPGVANSQPQSPDPIHSGVAGVTQVYVSGGLSVQDQAPKMAHELIDHAHKGVVLGLGAHIPKDNAPASPTVINAILNAATP